MIALTTVLNSVKMLAISCAHARGELDVKISIGVMLPAVFAIGIPLPCSQCRGWYRLKGFSDAARLPAFYNPQMSLLVEPAITAAAPFRIPW